MAVGAIHCRRLIRTGPSPCPANALPTTRESPNGSSALDRTDSKRILNVYPSEDAVRTRIQKWGNSLGLRIPRSFAEEAGVETGSEVDLTIRNGNLILKPAKSRKYRLKDLLRKVTEKNLHAEIETGDAVGREVW